uniref:Ribosomal protein S13 n=1 Tax=Symbiochloris sp. SG-2018 TaxID=2126034 RepID=A0A976U6W9_9CHLO|nr:ribosomal protein S13 [Symbiochloris sp. SG-2018]UVF37888.1 ribosomal protein S13 [Symbiochloris sp. SG-2018]
MVYLFQTIINDNQSIKKGLQKLYGIGPKSSQRIAELLGVSSKTRIDQLSQNQIEEIKSLISKNFKINNVLKRVKSENIRRLIEISSYRGFRHVKALPTRGQRTRDNARTAKKLLNRAPQKKKL